MKFCHTTGHFFYFTTSNKLHGKLTIIPNELHFLMQDVVAVKKNDTLHFPLLPDWIEVETLICNSSCIEECDVVMKGDLMQYSYIILSTICIFCVLLMIVEYWMKTYKPKVE